MNNLTISELLKNNCGVLQGSLINQIKSNQIFSDNNKCNTIKPN